MEIIQSKVLTMKEAAQYLRADRHTIVRMVRLGKIKANKVGSRYRFLQNELDKFLRNEDEGQYIPYATEQSIPLLVKVKILPT